MPFICLVCCFLIIFQLISWLGNPIKCVRERSCLFENPKLLGTEGKLRLQIVTTLQPPLKRKGDGVPSKASDASPECPFEFLVLLCFPGAGIKVWKQSQGLRRWHCWQSTWGTQARRPKFGSQHPPRSRAQQGASVIPLLERQGQENCWGSVYLISSKPMWEHVLRKTR